ncbi:tail fiber protein [Conexibacter stalactiti]|uniref:Tail fiber protein n=1 Tax=Conexibacter stalactiti TaxID=1940611 RepID=A0ABU4HYU1_9ACTN|nr:tail fiber protein [Conexibacter stalactiti]MDW5597650.1 tail fiber protein [Conexibacter stalactiti]MEC5038292.1 tail fiber protein [Conexibacter stalactiti]
MPATPSHRLNLHAPTGGDPADVPADIARLRDQLDDVVLGYGQGRLRDRPAAGVEGRQFYATDTATLYHDFGGGWVPYAWQPGDMRFSAAGSTPPSGWLLTEGQELYQDDYSPLFNAIGHVYSYGVTPGLGRFMLPRAVGRALIGTGVSTDPTLREIVLGQRGGEVMHALTVDEMPAHAHYFTKGIQYTSVPVGGPDSFNIPGIGFGATQSAGGNVPHNNMQPYLALNAWIKV